MEIHHKLREHIDSIKLPDSEVISKIFSKIPSPEKVSRMPSKLGLIPFGRRLNMKRISLILSVLVVLVLAVVFITKYGPTAFSVKEEINGDELPPCTNECSSESKLCENAQIFECMISADGCRHKNITESCPEGSICSTIEADKCYTPQSCDLVSHTCVTSNSFQLCRNGKTIEGAETKNCPEGLVCNKDPKKFSLCIKE